MLQFKLEWILTPALFTVDSYWDFNPLTDDKMLDWSKLKQITDDILKCI